MVIGLVFTKSLDASFWSDLTRSNDAFKALTAFGLIWTIFIFLCCTDRLVCPNKSVNASLLMACICRTHTLFAKSGAWSSRRLICSLEQTSVVCTVSGVSQIKYIKVLTICTFHYFRIIDKFVFCRIEFVLALLQTQANEANGRFDNSPFSVFLLLGLKFKTNRC